MDDHAKDTIGQIVKTRAISLRGKSSLAQRGIADLERLTADTEVLECVAAMREANSWEVRTSAWQRLRQFGPGRRGWVAVLRGLLAEQDGWLRIFAAESLSMHAALPGDTVPVLAATLSASIDTGANDWAMIASGAIWKYRHHAEEFAPDALAALIEALDIPNTDVQGYCTATLGCCGPRAKAAILPLAEIARNTNHDKLRVASLRALQQIDPGIGDYLGAFAVALHDEDPSIRGRAVCEIAKLGSDAVTQLPNLLALVEDPSSDVRRFLGFALGKIGDRSANTMAAVRKLFQDSEPSVCLASAYALLMLGIGQGVHHNYLCERLHHEDDFVRYLAAWALGEVGAFNLPLSLQALREACHSESAARVRSQITAALDRLRDTRT